ncbi:MAG: hypothetical protein KTR26_18150 [Flammeovirgaceae bacterium]|nr:hypothetical protein [Flammeovirgaceae bacterium]
MKIKGVTLFQISLIFPSLLTLGCNPNNDLPPLAYEVPEKVKPYIALEEKLK